MDAANARRTVSVQILGGALAAECKRSQRRRPGNAWFIAGAWRRRSSSGDDNDRDENPRALRENRAVKTFGAAGWLSGIGEICGGARGNRKCSNLRPIDEVG